MKKFRRKKAVSMKLDIAPLIDVMFMLLLFFLLASSFLNPSILLNLPKAGNADMKNEKSIVVSIDEKENIYINKDLIQLKDFKMTLARHIKFSPGKKIIFQGDENILYKKFVKILDIIKGSGAKEVAIAHKKN